MPPNHQNHARSPSFLFPVTTSPHTPNTQTMGTTPANNPKFVSKGKLVDSLPLSARASRLVNHVVFVLSLYIWTLFSLNAKQSLTTYQNPSSSGPRRRPAPEKPRFGQVNNPN